MVTPGVMERDVFAVAAIVKVLEKVVFLWVSTSFSAGVRRSASPEIRCCHVAGRQSPNRRDC